MRPSPATCRLTSDSFLPHRPDISVRTSSGPRSFCVGFLKWFLRPEETPSTWSRIRIDQPEQSKLVPFPIPSRVHIREMRVTTPNIPTFTKKPTAINQRALFISAHYLRLLLVSSSLPPMYRLTYYDNDKKSQDIINIGLLIISRSGSFISRKIIFCF